MVTRLLDKMITASAPELSWLFTQLPDIFAGCLDGQTKIEFFGRLAKDSALRYSGRKQGEEALQDLLGAVLHEALQ